MSIDPPTQQDFDLVSTISLPLEKEIDIYVNHHLVLATQDGRHYRIEMTTAVDRESALLPEQDPLVCPHQVPPALERQTVEEEGIPIRDHPREVPLVVYRCYQWLSPKKSVGVLTSSSVIATCPSDGSLLVI